MRLLGYLWRGLLFLLFVYIVSWGATYSGIVYPGSKMFSLGLMAFLSGLWLFLRWRGGWQWNQTPLDAVLVLWALAFGAGLLVNLEAWRRIMIGLWFVGLYLAVWYVLNDLVANRALRRVLLMDALLFVGIVMVLLAYWQVSLLPFDLATLRFPRPGGALGNPNFLGTFLVMVLPVTIARAVYPRNPIERVLMSIYALLVGLLLFFTFSRGAWIGAGASLVALVGLVLQRSGLLSGRNLAVWWARRGRLQQTILGGSVVAALVVVLAVAALLIQSLNAPGRSVNLRFAIYQSAWELFTEAPLTGHGLYTFGQGMERLESMPPQLPHSHAHNAVLHLAAELGLLGLVAAAVTVFLLSRAMLRNWIQAERSDVAPVLGGIAAAVGFGVHHLTDTTWMMPTIALMGVFILVMSAAPVQPVPLASRWRQIGHPVGMVALPVALLVTGIWSGLIYSRYIDGLNRIVEADYAGAALALQPVIEADPAMSVYHWQQGYLYGVASLAEPDYTDEAIAAYERFVELEPQSDTGWVNLAALRWQANDQQGAIAAMERAVENAPLAWQFKFGLARYLEATNQEERARVLYGESLSWYTRLYPVWDRTPLSQEMADGLELVPEGEIVLAVADAWHGGAAVDREALERWWQSLDRRNLPRTSIYAIGMLLTGEPVAEAELDDLAEQIESLTTVEQERIWLHLFEAERARQAGDNEAYTTALGEVEALTAFDREAINLSGGNNLGYVQFLRYLYPLQFLPQVIFPSGDPYLLALLTES
ncbi:MAG: O-antigen ligase family protein [bacterium]|nr:O-antigen ligase family protein [bacterium]